MDMQEAKKRLDEVEPLLAVGKPVEFWCFERDGRKLRVLITNRLKSRAQKEHLWGTKPILKALKNASYGFDPMHPRSRGGADGIFLVDRNYCPGNTMMKKLFDGFLDKPGDEAEQLASQLSFELADMLPVRLVSHDLRLLGLLRRGEDGDTLVLVDCD